MKLLVIVFAMLLSAASAVAQVSIGVFMPGVNIGISVPVYPQLVRVPGYPVYYSPSMRSNYFFYDGMYWVYQGDNWYASSWYNGPWGLVGPEAVPVFVLRVPVRYYRSPPSYFGGWRASDAPHWGEHWGRDWEQRRNGWDHWDRRAMPAPAPLPAYQRQYSGTHYPSVAQQPTLRTQNYRYQPRDEVVQQHFREQAARPQQSAPAQRLEAQSGRPAPVQQQERPAVHEPPRSSRQAAPQPAENAAPKAAPREATQRQPQARGKEEERDREKGERGDERSGRDNKR